MRPITRLDPDLPDDFEPNALDPSAVPAAELDYLEVTADDITEEEPDSGDDNV